jgi:hypothetical protein
MLRPSRPATPLFTLVACVILCCFVGGSAFAQTPTITSISPTALSPGMQVTLTGSGFGAAQGSGRVDLQNSSFAPVVSWSDTQIVVTVPAGTVGGHAYVGQNGTWSNGFSFTMIPPTLSSVSPNALSPGMQVTLTGSGFGATQGSLGRVWLQNSNVPVVSWSDTQIVVTVPADTIGGNAYVEQNGAASNLVSFSMIPPTLSSVSPTALSPGMQVTLTGSGFTRQRRCGDVGDHLRDSPRLTPGCKQRPVQRSECASCELEFLYRRSSRSQLARRQRSSYGHRWRDHNWPSAIQRYTLNNDNISRLRAGWHNSHHYRFKSGQLWHGQFQRHGGIR